jgi:putative cell wall-binding protein/spore germination protein YaaH
LLALIITGFWPGILLAAEPAAQEDLPENFVSHRAEQDATHATDAIPKSDLPATIQSTAVQSESVTANSLSNEIWGFHPYWLGTAWQNYRWSTLSTLAFFKIEVNYNGVITTSNPNYEPDPALISTAHANGVKVVLAVTVVDASAQEKLLRSATYRNTAVTQIVNKVIATGTDGVNVDFEGISGSDRANFVSFMQQLTTQMHASLPGSSVSVDLPAIDWSSAYDTAALGQFVDRLMIMTYDYCGPWTNGYACPVAPLYDTAWRSNYSVAASLATHLSLAPANKTLLGVPWYGASWRTASGTVPSNETSWLGHLRYFEAEDEAASNSKHWYATSQVPYTTGSPTFQTWYDDSASLTAKYQYAEAQGVAGVAVWALGYDGNRPEMWDALQAYGDASADPLQRLAGSNRYETAVATSQDLYPSADTADAVVLATGKNWPDALGGAVLARVKNGPLLLTDPADITPITASEIDRVLPSGGLVFLLGGTGAVSTEVENDLKGLGFTVARIAGSNRIETAAGVATAAGGTPTNVMLATSRDYADALSLSSPAAISREPILLTDPTAVPQATLDYLKGSFGAGVTMVTIAGGESAVSDSVVQQLQSLGYTVQRLSGADRYATSATIASTFFPVTSSISLATGQNYADGLTGGPHAAAQLAPMLLVKSNDLPQPIWSYIEQRAVPIVGGHIYGGTAVINNAVKNVAQTLFAP